MAGNLVPSHFSDVFCYSLSDVFLRSFVELRSTMIENFCTLQFLVSLVSWTAFVLHGSFVDYESFVHFTSLVLRDSLVRYSSLVLRGPFVCLGSFVLPNSLVH